MSRSFNRYAEWEPTADKLRDVLKACDVNFYTLARRVGQHKESPSRYARGACVPDVATFREILLALPVIARKQLLQVAFRDCSIAFESTEPLPISFMDADGDGDVDHHDRARHLIHASIGAADAQMTADNPRATQFDLIDKRDVVERHLQAAVEIQ